VVASSVLCFFFFFLTSILIYAFGMKKNFG